MTYITTNKPIEGLEDRCERVQKILRTLHDNGFKNPIVYGEGLSHFLNNPLLSRDEHRHRRLRKIVEDSLDKAPSDTASKNTNDDFIGHADLKIECEFPENLKPGILRSIFSTNAGKHQQCVQNARIYIDSLPGYVSELRRITSGRAFYETGADTIKLMAHGNRNQKVQILAHNKAPQDSIPSVQEALSREFGTINKIAMRYDEKEDAIMTTRHKDWLADCKSGTFRIPGAADINEMNRSLVYYFSELSDGHMLHLETDNLDDDKSRYVQTIHDAVLSMHDELDETLNKSDGQNARAHSRDKYDRAVDTMETLSDVCEEHLESIERIRNQFSPR